MYTHTYAVAYLHTCILTYSLCILYVGEKIVLVKTHTRILTLRAKPTDTVLDIKGKIETETGFSVCNQQLKLEGKPLPLLNSDVLPSSAELTLELKSKFYGQYHNK